MRASATCSLCGHAYTHPTDLDAKTGMHCAACGALIYAVTGQPFGAAPAAADEGPSRKTAGQTQARHTGLPPVKRQPDPENTAAQALRNQRAAIIQDNQELRHGSSLPATAILAWLLAFVALILAFVFPSYGNDATDALYMLQWLPSIIFGCTSAILFILGMIAATRR